jgi:hypothetical protein
VPQALQDCKVEQVLQVEQVQLEQVARQVQQVLVVVQEELVLLAVQEQQVLVVLQEEQDPQGHRVKLVQLDLLEHPVLQAEQVPQVLQVLEVQLVPQVPRGLQEGQEVLD